MSKKIKKDISHIKQGGSIDKSKLLESIKDKKESLIVRK